MSRVGKNLAENLDDRLIDLDIRKLAHVSNHRCSLAQKSRKILKFGPCGRTVRASMRRGGGIGRRSGLKIRRWQHLGGSSPPPGTTDIYALGAYGGVGADCQHWKPSLSLNQALFVRPDTDYHIRGSVPQITFSASNTFALGQKSFWPVRI